MALVLRGEFRRLAMGDLLTPRARRVPLGPSHEELAPPHGVTLADLPAEIRALTGEIRRGELPRQGYCSLLWFLEAEGGPFVLKIVQGAYRGAELRAEHEVLLALTWTNWLDAALTAAERNLHSGAFDPDEFTPADPPARVFARLQAERPGPGRVCLLHGDYRTKNLLWQDGRMTGVIDWGHADFGDPYYVWPSRMNTWKALKSASSRPTACRNWSRTGSGIAPTS